MSERFEHALVVGKFAPPHRGHQLLLDTATAASKRLTILVWANPDFGTMPSERRAEWLRELYPEADIFVPEGPPVDDAPDDDHRQFVKRSRAGRGADQRKLRRRLRGGARHPASARGY
jgi:HTH-type transcriptional regulator, transcriptional repressor of NAD biosynthesis genes